MIRPLYNIHLKLLALLSAIILWFIVITVENTVYPYPEEVEVQVMNLSSHLSLANKIPKVRLFLRVGEAELKTLSKNDLMVFVDLKNAEAGENEYVIETGASSTNAKILKIEPGKMRLRLSPTTEKEVKVEVKVVGDPLEGYNVAEVRAATESIKVRGAQSIIEGIDHVIAELILDGSEKNDLNRSVMLGLGENMEEISGLVEMVPEQMVVSAAIISEMKQKSVTVTPGYLSENDRTAWENRVTIAPDSVLVKGSEEALAALNSIATKPFEGSLLIRAGSVEVGFELPEGIALVTPDQKAIIELIPAETGDETEPDVQPGTLSNGPTI